jgi:hypothetical protein
VQAAVSPVRQIHAILSSACKRAVRWNWISSNPVDNAEPPRGNRPNQPGLRTLTRWSGRLAAGDFLDFLA